MVSFLFASSTIVASFFTLDIYGQWLWIITSKPCYLQKHSFADLLQNRCSLKFRKLYKKTPVLEPLFYKVAGLKSCNFIKKGLQHKCFPFKLAKFLRPSFSQNTSGGSASVFVSNFTAFRVKVYFDVFIAPAKIYDG